MNDSQYSDAINHHYGQTDLVDRIFDAYRRAGKSTDTLTRDDLTPLDEFHTRGREATRELAALANLPAGARVLDLGSGIGGPARTLAAEFGLRVTGIDLTESYVELANLLTGRVGLSDGVSFHHGDATDMPFENAEFDAVFSQHMMMNIPNRADLLREIHRVLRPGGQLVLHEILAGSNQPVLFPVPWANSEAINFLVSSEDMLRLLQQEGFEQQAWRDVSDESLAFFQKAAARPDGVPHPLGINLLMGDSSREKLRNITRNLDEQRIVVVQGVFTRA